MLTALFNSISDNLSLIIQVKSEDKGGMGNAEPTKDNATSLAPRVSLAWNVERRVK